MTSQGLIRKTELIQTDPSAALLSGISIARRAASSLISCDVIKVFGMVGYPYLLESFPIIWHSKFLASLVVGREWIIANS